MPGQFQFSVDTAMETLRRWSDAGIPAVLLFGIPDHKDATGSQAWDERAAVQRLCREIKKSLPRMVVITDVCLCEYTEHGHCGVLKAAAGAGGGGQRRDAGTAGQGSLPARGGGRGHRRRRRQ